jgi:hypothetical protein
MSRVSDISFCSWRTSTLRIKKRNSNFVTEIQLSLEFVFSIAKRLSFLSYLYTVLVPFPCPSASTEHTYRTYKTTSFLDEFQSHGGASSSYQKMSNFDPNAILRGAQLTVVGGMWLGERKKDFGSMKNSWKWRQHSELYRIQACLNMSIIVRPPWLSVLAYWSDFW